MSSRIILNIIDPIMETSDVNVSLKLNGQAFYRTISGLWGGGVKEMLVFFHVPISITFVMVNGLTPKQLGQHGGFP